MDKLLNALSNVSDRSAQFRTVVACIVDGKQFECEGILSGSIATKRTGTGGFGYDPIFVPDGYTESFGVLDASVKNSISHRAKAFIKCRDQLTRI